MTSTDSLTADDLGNGPDTSTEGRRSGPRSAPVVASGLAIVFGGLGLLVPSLVDSDYYMRLLLQGVFLSMLTLGIGFLMRHLGLISLGHTAFFGGAAYGVAMAATHWSFGPLPAALFGFGLGCVLAVIMGSLVVRASGMAFLMLTLALEQALAEIVVQQSARPVTGGWDGLALSFEPGDTFFGIPAFEMLDSSRFWPVAWILLVLLVLGLWFLQRSGFGKILEGIRENEERMRFSGFNTVTPRFIAFVLSGALASLGGALFALNAGYVSPEVLGFVDAGNALVAAILGGSAGSLAGPIIGAVLFTYGRAKLNLDGNIDLYTGAALAVVLIFFAGGVSGAISKLVRYLRSRKNRTERS